MKVLLSTILVFFMSSTQALTAVFGSIYSAVGGNYDQTYFRNLGILKSAINEVNMGSDFEIGKLGFVSGVVDGSVIQYYFFLPLDSHVDCEDRSATLSLSFDYDSKPGLVSNAKAELKCSKPFDD